MISNLAQQVRNGETQAASNLQQKMLPLAKRLVHQAATSRHGIFYAVCRQHPLFMDLCVTTPSNTASENITVINKIAQDLCTQLISALQATPQAPAHQAKTIRDRGRDMQTCLVS